MVEEAVLNLEASKQNLGQAICSSEKQTLSFNKQIALFQLITKAPKGFFEKRLKLPSNTTNSFTKINKAPTK